MFKEKREIYVQKFGRDEDMVYTKSVLAGLVFHNDEDAVDRALAKGEIFSTTKNGQTLYGYKQLTAGREIGGKKSTSTSSTKDITDNEYHAIADKLDQMNWDFDISKKDQLMIEDKHELPDKYQDRFNEAIAFCVAFVCVCFV